MVLTYLFLRTDSVWVELREEAREFGNPKAAIRYCVSHGIEGARLLLVFGDSKADLYVDVFGVARPSNAQLKMLGRDKDHPRTCGLGARSPPAHVGGGGMKGARSWYRDHFGG